MGEEKAVGRQKIPIGCLVEEVLEVDSEDEGEENAL
jgi:hypothetical protein